MTTVLVIIYLIGVIISFSIAWSQAADAEEENEDTQYACCMISVCAVLSWIYPLFLFYYARKENKNKIED